MSTIHIAMLDVATTELADFDAWYRATHLPSILTRPGWLAAHTYTCSSPSPSLLTVYDLDEHETERRGQVSAAPFSREHEYGQATVHAYHGETYRQLGDWANGDTRGDLLNIISTDVRPEHASAFDHWYRTRHTPEILRCPGWLSARRFASIDRPGRFLTMYELSDEEQPFSTPEYRQVVGWDEHVDHLIGFHGFRIYGHRYTVEGPQPARARRTAGPA